MPKYWGIHCAVVVNMLRPCEQKKSCHGVYQNRWRGVGWHTRHVTVKHHARLAALSSARKQSESSRYLLSFFQNCHNKLIWHVLVADSYATIDARSTLQLPQHDGCVCEDHQERRFAENDTRDQRRCGWSRTRSRHVLRLLRENEESAQRRRTSKCFSPR